MLNQIVDNIITWPAKLRPVVSLSPTMLDRTIESFITWPAKLSPLLALGIFYLVKYVFTKTKRPKFDAPMLYDETGDIDLVALDATIKADFQKYKGKFFTLGEAHGETVVLPIKFIEELKALPDNVLNLEDDLSERMIAEHSLFTPAAVGGRGSIIIDSVKNGLTKSLGGLMGDISDEIRYSFNEDGIMPPCEEWTEVDIRSILVRIVALVSGRIFIGLPMNRDEEYLDCIINFTLNVFYSVPDIRKYPPFLRWASKYLSPKVKEVHKSLATMKRLLKPVVEENKRLIENNEAPSTLSVWSLKNSNQKEQSSLPIQAQVQLVTSMAAIHTTSMTVTNTMYDLAARPDYVHSLRDEIAAVKATETMSYMSKSSMPRLKKLDSFVKESQRVNPISLLSMRRRVGQTITLHDGTVLPSGTHIAFPSHEVSNDPQLWDEPDKFDGFRFAKLRQTPGNEAKHQFVTTGKEHLHFGHGVHACPGRFFASNEIKMILIHLLENYDFKFADRTDRPDNLWTPGGYIPDPSVKVLVKKREA